MLQKSIYIWNEFDLNFNVKIDYLIETPKTSESQEITADDCVDSVFC
jgi:hypothetical protein